jgi:hypothetical protein
MIIKDTDGQMTEDERREAVAEIEKIKPLPTAADWIASAIETGDVTMPSEIAAALGILNRNNPTIVIVGHEIGRAQATRMIIESAAARGIEIAVVGANDEAELTGAAKQVWEDAAPRLDLQSIMPPKSEDLEAYIKERRAGRRPFHEKFWKK